ncbi:MAG: S9 family peptidase [Ruminococcus flavefaciens]|nr:S9 family peptidase [Ruminococcus flavefaciens]
MVIKNISVCLFISFVLSFICMSASVTDIENCRVILPDSGLVVDERYMPVFNDTITSDTTFATSWTERRKELRSEWMTAIGRWPELLVDNQLEYVDTMLVEDVTCYTVKLEWLPGSYTTGYLLVPRVVMPAPAIITLYYEPETAVGFGDLPNRDFARQLARCGFITLSLGTSETTSDRTYGIYYPSVDDVQMESLSAMACAAANAYHALVNSRLVDPGRVGVMGHSYGGKWAMFASCLYDRFACAVWGDPGIVFDESMGGYVNYWEPWYLGYRPRPWTSTWSDDVGRAGFGAYRQLRNSGHDLHELHALMAPRPFLVSGGLADGEARLPALYPTVQLYDKLGCSGCVYFSHRLSHDPDEESNQLICDFFGKYLSPTAQCQ